MSRDDEPTTPAAEPATPPPAAEVASEPPPAASASLNVDRLSASVEEIERAIESAMARLEAQRKLEADKAAATAKHKEGINRQVSIAALLLTMMLSFLGFVRAQSDSDASADKAVALQSKNDQSTEWSLYQVRTAQRASFVVAEDDLARAVLGLAAGDPARRLARFHHHEYEAKVRALDDENRRVFHHIQGLARREYLALRDAAHHDAQTDRYDMGIRTLTLALVLISVTLLVDRAYLFWFGLAVSALGAGFGISGYFLG
jgi:hypothetical protein